MQEILKKEIPDGWDLYASRWFRYEHLGGTGCCQPDIYIVSPERIAVFECKRTWTANADAQMLELYVPVLGRYYSKRQKGAIEIKRVTVFRFAAEGLPEIGQVKSLSEVFDSEENSLWWQVT